MFTFNKVSKSMLDAVDQVLNEDEFKPKKKLILEPEKHMTKEEESGLRMAAHAAHRQGKKSFEFQGKTYPVNVSEEEEEDSKCVTEPKAKEIAKKEVKGHEKSMHHKEEVEQIDEISKKTLGSYIKKASVDATHHAYTQGQHASTAVMKKDKDIAGKKEANRIKGIERATDRLTGEEVEIDEEERHMTPGEMRARERIVKSMKKGAAGFKLRYGERAKSVMYATATKQAMKEDAEQIDEESPLTGTRKVASYGDHANRAEVRYNPEWQEYSVHHYKDGKHMGEGPVSYHGGGKDGKEDAHSTAKHEAERRAMKEDAEQIDELSSDTLKSYVKKRGKDVEADIRDAKGARQNAKDYPDDAAGWKDESDWLGKRAKKGLDKLKLAAKKVKQRNEETEQLDEFGGISTISDEATDTAQKTTDTLKGRVKGGVQNQHGPDRKVKLKAEETNKSPMSLAKELAHKSFKKIRQETMMGKIGTSEEKYK